MEKLKKTAKALDILTAIIGGVLWVVPIAGLIYLGIFFFAPQEKWNAAFINELDLGSLRLTLSSDYLPTKSALVVPVIASVLLLILGSVIGIIVCRVIRKLLHPMREGMPFEGSVSRGLSRLGWIVLIGGGAGSIGARVCEMLMLRATHALERALELLDTDAFTQITLTEKFDLTFVVVAVVLFLLSFVFQYGEELQKLSDETL